MTRLSSIALAAIALTALAACDAPTGLQPSPGGGGGMQSRQPAPGPAEPPGPIAQAPTNTSALPTFDAADQNEDGVISGPEALTIGGLEFSQADTNGDDELSPQEYASAMQPRPRG